MGSRVSKSTDDNEYGQDIKQTAEEFIKNTKKIINDTEKVNPHHHKISDSIRDDIDNLNKILYEGGEIKMGILGRSNNQEKFMTTLYGNGNLHDDSVNTSITQCKSTKKYVYEHTISSDNTNINNITKFHFSSKEHKKSNIKFLNYNNTSIIDDNLIVTSSSKLNKLELLSNNKDTSLNFDIDIDDMVKYLLFSVLHDIVVYLPDSYNIDNEISYLEYISDNMLILKLLRRNNFLILHDKFVKKSTNLQSLINKLGKTVVKSLDFYNSERDKIKFFGAMIYKHGDSYLQGANYTEISYIKSRFDEILKKDEYDKYEIEINEKIAQEKKIKEKNPKYESREIKKLSYKDYRENFVNNFSSTFSSSSNIENIEDHIFQSLMKILSSKVNLFKSNITYKLVLFQNFKEFESDDEFMNDLIMVRNEMLEEIDNNFVMIKNNVNSKKQEILSLCDDLMNKETNRKSEVLKKETPQSKFLDVFDITGNFSPFNSYISETRANYYNFNNKIFKEIAEISNASFKSLEILSRTIAMKFATTFMNIEKMQMKKGNESYKFNSFNNDNDMFEGLSIEEIIKFKLERISILPIHLLSVFGCKNFKLKRFDSNYSYFSYGGVLFFLTMSVFTFKSKSLLQGLKFGLPGVVVSGLCLYLSNYLKGKYIEESEKNYINSVDKMISFITVTKDKFISFDEVIDKFHELYSKEALELIDLLVV